MAADAAIPQNEADPGTRQLLQHLKTFQYLCQKPKGSDSLPELTEDMVKQTHEIMMRGLTNKDWMSTLEPIKMVLFGRWSHFPLSWLYSNCYGTNCERIQEISQTHDRYQLASWKWSNQSTFVETANLFPLS